MKSIDLVENVTIQQWAIRQLADYDRRQPGTLFAEVPFSLGQMLSVSDAYRVQKEVVRLRRQRGEHTVGYKVGCTSPKIRAQLGIDHSISGHLFECEQYLSGTELPCHRFASLAIEGELAIELSHSPTADDFLAILPTCVSRVFPVIELHHHVIRGAIPSPGELIANNAIHAGFVAGKGIDAADCPASLDDLKLKILSDGQVADQCEGAALIQTIRSSLKWLMDSLRTRNDKLTEGQVILTGSIPSLIPIQTNCIVRVDAPPFGSVETTFVS